MKDGQIQTQTIFDELTQLACELGASDATVIPTDEISVEDDLAALCKEPRCQNYGLSASCPPHVVGPAGFRKLQNKIRHALVFRIDVPSEILLSDQRRDIFQLLHEIAAGIEQAAIKRGFSNSKAFAGGSCKKLFCNEHDECRVLAEGDGCRHPDRARPSMSGFGINVSKMMKSAGWHIDRITRETDPEKVRIGTVSGIVLIN
jgi:predicted metal-binding protein